MAIKPILFNTDMVRAIQDGRKTVTRRVFKPHNSAKANSWGYYQGNGLWVDTGTDNPDNKGHIKDYSISSLWMSIDYYIEHYAPFQPGDILYVRETWTTHYEPDKKGKPVEKYCYKADGINIDAECLPGETNRWHPSIHMPKEAARLWLRVTDVRVERLQDIDAGGIKGEGLSTMAAHCGDMEIAQKEFAILWDSTIKKSDLDIYGWAANPWVWRIGFERCERPEGV